jgi:hypothetical protein
MLVLLVRVQQCLNHLLTWFATVTDFRYDVFVLWGQGFDEIAASIFVGELRRSGIRVKLVGLHSRQITGQHGITLVPDITLEQALYRANRTCCIIIPAPLLALQQFSYDPRLAELLRLTAENQALIVVDAFPTADVQASNRFLPSLHNGLEYPQLEELISFVPDVLMPRLNGAF